MPSALKSLRGKQRAFVEEYVKDFNATAAAKRAGYSEKTAYSIADEILKKPEVQQAISELQEQRSKELKISADTVIKEIAELGFSNILDFVRWTSQTVELIDSNTLDRRKAAAISEISMTAHGVKIKLHSKLDALDKLAKHLGLYDDEGRDKRSPEEVAANIVAAVKAMNDITTKTANEEMD